MKASVSVEQFRDGVQKVLSVVDKKNYMPILAYCLVKTEDNYIEVSATNLEISTRVKIEAQVSEHGILCLNAKNLSDILREMPTFNVDIVLNKEKNTLDLSSENIHFTLFTYNSDEFPKLTFDSSEAIFQIKAEDLVSIINKTSHAVSDDETRLYLNGVYLQEIDSKIRAVATDGHRLSLVDSNINSSDIDSLSRGIIIPRKGAYEIKRIAESVPESMVKVSVDNSFIYINADNKYYLSIRLIARDYPKYESFIPSKSSCIVKANRASFMDAVKRIRIMSNEKSNGVRIKLSGSEMVLTAQNPSLGDADEKLDVSYDGQDMEIGFNAKYLLDTLSTFDDGEVSVELNNELSPVIIKSSSESNHLGLIMPLKL